MAKISQAGKQVLAGKNFTSHTRVYVNGTLQLDTSTGMADAPVIGYQLNRSRKLGAGRLVLTVSNPGGRYSYRWQDAPIFGYGNTIKVQEGLDVGGTCEWFTRFTGVIVSQVATNTGGKPALKVYAMDNMKLLLNYLPDDLYYRPNMVKVTGEVLVPVDETCQHYRGSRQNLPWVDIPYPIFYKNGTKIKENYDIDLINGEVYFGEKMWTPGWAEATRISALRYSVPVMLYANTLIRRSFRLLRYGPQGQVEQQLFENNEIPAEYMPSYLSGYEINFNQEPFADLGAGSDWQYTDKRIYVTTSSADQVRADYWYYDDNTNLAESVITDLALKAGFCQEQIILEPTNVSLKPLRFTNLTVKNGFEALQKIKQQLSPNYIITCDCEGNLRGYHASQAVTEDFEIELVKRIESPVTEEGVYTAVVAHGVDLNPNDLGKTASAVNLAPGASILNVNGSPACLFNKNVDDQISWRWVKKNDAIPPEFPIDLLKITLAEAKKIEEISILVGDYQGGTVQQSISVQVSENGENDWFYVNKSSRGLSGASSQWVTVKDGELENRKIKGIKIAAETASEWVETHTYSESSSGFLFFDCDISVYTDNYYSWYFAIKEIQIWEENTIAVTSSLGNYIGTGDGRKVTFNIPNLPVVQGSEIVYLDGQRKAISEYTLNPATGELTFVFPPTGLVTVDYAVATKIQPVFNSTVGQRYANNVTVINPPGTVAFTGGAIQVNSPEYKLLKRIGTKKVATKADNYLNCFSDVKKRGQEMLQEITRLGETLDIDVVYRPDCDVCQTVYIYDDTLHISGLYFIEEITETKQGYKPALNLKVCNYNGLNLS